LAAINNFTLVGVVVPRVHALQFLFYEHRKPVQSFVYTVNLQVCFLVKTTCFIDT